MTNGGVTQGTLWFFSGAMFSVGMQMAETGAALERMTSDLGLDPGQQGLLVSVRFIGGILVGLVLWAGHARIRFRAILFWSLALVVMSGALLLVPTYPAALLLATLRGLSVGAIIPLSGMFGAAQQRWSPGLVASTVNAAVSAGLVLLSLVAVLLSTIPAIPWQAYWAVSSVIGIILLVLLPTVSFPGAPEAGFALGSSPPESPITKASAASATDWALAAAGLMLVGSESILLGLIPAQSAAVSPLTFTGEFYALVLMTAIFVRRSLGTVLFRVATTSRVITVSVAVIATGGILWSLIPGLAPLSVFLSGLGTASFFPGLIAFVSETKPAKAGATIAAIGWTGGLGGTLLPAVTGFALSAGIPNRLTSGFVVCAAVGAYILVRGSESLRRRE